MAVNHQYINISRDRLGWATSLPGNNISKHTELISPKLKYGDRGVKHEKKYVFNYFIKWTVVTGKICFVNFKLVTLKLFNVFSYIFDFFIVFHWILLLLGLHSTALKLQVTHSQNIWPKSIDISDSVLPFVLHHHVPVEWDLKWGGDSDLEN